MAGLFVTSEPETPYWTAYRLLVREWLEDNERIPSRKESIGLLSGDKRFPQVPSSEGILSEDMCLEVLFLTNPCIEIELNQVWSVLRKDYDLHFKEGDDRRM